jgi:hypothetical protein
VLWEHFVVSIIVKGFLCLDVGDSPGSTQDAWNCTPVTCTTVVGAWGLTGSLRQEELIIACQEALAGILSNLLQHSKLFADGACHARAISCRVRSSVAAELNPLFAHSAPLPVWDYPPPGALPLPLVYLLLVS